MPILTSAALTQALNALPDWKLTDGAIVRAFSFRDFREAMSFVNSVAVIAEKAGHHPDIDIRYNKVKLALASHDAGGITEKDLNQAEEINKLL
jgi:4a-hydroxytetrahydrobiopterin dehydratase